MNLYHVWDRHYEWCCFAFNTTRNRAKARVAELFDQEYIDMRCKTLKRGVNVPVPMVVDCDTDEGYDMVLKCGYRYATEEELNEWEDRW